MGTLTNSTHRQPSSEVSTPPINTPAAPPAPPAAAQRPRARGSRSPENVVTMIVRVAGDKNAAPIPWAARAAVNQVDVWANPPTRLVAEKSTTPNR